MLVGVQLIVAGEFYVKEAEIDAGTQVRQQDPRSHVEEDTVRSGLRYHIENGEVKSKEYDELTCY